MIVINNSLVESFYSEFESDITLDVTFRGNLEEQKRYLIADALHDWLSRNTNGELFISAIIDEGSLFAYTSDNKDIIDIDYEFKKNSTSELIIYQMISEHPDFRGRGFMQHMQAQLINIYQSDSVLYNSVLTGMPFVRSMENLGLIQEVEVFYKDIHPGSISARAKVNHSNIKRLCA